MHKTPAGVRHIVAGRSAEADSPWDFSAASMDNAGMSDILLATLNARYSHASLGLRCLLANMGELRAHAELREYTTKRAPLEIVEDLLSRKPRLIGFGVYIWNIVETTRVVAILKALAPEVRIVLGGPEVSHETEGQEIVGLADHIITGPGELSFAALCGQVFSGENPTGRIIPGEVGSLAELALPYGEYTDEDIRQRVIYVEASRGCPFKCEFCLSALDKTAKPFPLEHFLDAMDTLHQRGARQFKFVDRTFNLDVRSASHILEFFLARLDEKLFLHFEIVPDHLPEALKALIVRFPAGSLQFEVGIQSFNPWVQAQISRKQDNARTEINLRWLRQHTQAHIHADLIVGLPGESLQSFAEGFDRLLALGPHEIQVGLLKRLRGAPIARHTVTSGLRFNPLPPYDILATGQVDFTDMRRMARFARYWDILANSGCYKETLKLIIGDSPFHRFMVFSDWLYARTGATHELAAEKLWRWLEEYLINVCRAETTAARQALSADIALTGVLGIPGFLRDGPKANRQTKPAGRQERHQQFPAGPTTRPLHP
jgi:radical SAM superfamily enzyme YgiQ (UPF0313 family)